MRAAGQLKKKGKIVPIDRQNLPGNPAIFACSLEQQYLTRRKLCHRASQSMTNDCLRGAGTRIAFGIIGHKPRAMRDRSRTEMHYVF